MLGIPDLIQYSKQRPSIVTFEPLNPEPGTDQFRLKVACATTTVQHLLDVDLTVFSAFSGLIVGPQAAAQIKRYGLTWVIVG